MKHHILFICSLLLAAVLSVPALAIEKSPKPHRQALFGLRVGLLGSGTFSRGSSDYEKDGDLTFGLFADAPSGTNLTFGAFLDFHKFPITTPTILLFSGGSAEPESKTMVNFGVACKYTFASNNGKLLFRPGISVGYGRLSEVIFSGQGHYFTLGFLFETIALFSERTGIVGDLGVIMVPVGGNGYGTVSNDGMLVLRGGLVF